MRFCKTLRTVGLAALVSGTKAFAFTLKTAGTSTIAVQDTARVFLFEIPSCEPSMSIFAACAMNQANTTPTASISTVASRNPGNDVTLSGAIRRCL